MIERHYSGTPIESGNTALHNNVPAPAVRWLVEQRILVKGMSVLDYGAGHGRNARFLRDEGLSVYAYDPYNARGGCYADGWVSVSDKLPLDKIVFNTFLTSFVLNVVPKHVEAEIIDYGQGLDQIHIVRNRDLRDSVMNGITRGDRSITEWYSTEYDQYRTTPFNIDALCTFGVRTSRGFQRDVDLQDYGLGIEHQTHGYKIFMR